MLRSLIADGVLVRIRRGVLVGACVAQQAATDPLLEHRLRVAALLLAFDDCAASHESAAVVHGLPVLDLPRYVIGTRPSGAWRGGPDARVRIAPRAALVTGDAAARRCGLTEIEAALNDSAVWADLGRAGRSVALLDPRSESPLESVSRAIFIEQGLPMPMPQVVLEPARGCVYRVDFFWAEQRVVGEADGLVKYDDPKALRMEKIRQEFIERMDIQVVRWTWRDMLVETDPTIGRLRRALGW